MAIAKQNPKVKPRVENTSADLMSDLEATDSDCESVAMEEEEIVVDSGQTEEQVKCLEIQEMTRALANVVEIQMHINCCIKLAEKFPH
ncbi:hypothetical protein NPIL_14431 [Nephila pilipes]|uniref:Uncharacterized protein n=1 Tax=Nephila pilipes TaxID=299642 RepID=A0A8X6P4G8_NEPPI|nr:hypothetical protein NPIL_69681 [Nephila pilipes]GFT51064.1 hypothetical protein NPIL_14431 [Nephila pilipes]